MQIDIVIKSFNRPFYLDRCIQSINKHVHVDYCIKILDDGTLKKYLDKICNANPNLCLKTSNLYHDKCQKISDHIQNISVFSSEVIPWDFWVNSIQSCSDIFLLIEDDFWFVKSLNIDEFANVMKSYNMSILKLFTWNNDKVISGEKIKITENIDMLKPWFFSNAIYYCIFYYLIKNVRIRNYLSYLIASLKNYYLNSYSVYAVAGALFNKKYWLTVCQNAGSTIDERLQVLNALDWYKTHPEKNIGYTTNDYLKTTFQSSALSGSLGKMCQVDMILLNYILSELWCDSHLDPMNNFPNDIDLNYMKSLIGNSMDSRCSFESWDLWIATFKRIYESYGYKV